MSQAIVGQFPQPTVSVLVPVWLDGDDRTVWSPRVLVIKFRPHKHGGGIGVPGERLDVVMYSVLDQAAICCREELGLTVPKQSFVMLGFRSTVGRDIRKGVSIQKKLNHGREIPGSLAGVPNTDVWTHHTPDLLFVTAWFATTPLPAPVFPWNEPVDGATLQPDDTVEVERIATLDVRGEYPPLPISDDHVLLRHWASVAGSPVTQQPKLLMLG